MRLFALSKLITKCLFLIFLGGISIQVMARDLEEIQAEGVLRHLGVPYASFVTQYTEGSKNSHSGLDIELMQNFAKHLGVEYQFIPATWNNVFGKLTGRNGQFIDNQVVYSEQQVIEGDVMAHGVTILDWRKEIIDFSDDYFPSAVWLIARTESELDPIVPTGSMSYDITAVKALIYGRDVLAMKQSCLDPDLYDLYATGANVILPAKRLQLNEMVPAILNKEAEMTLLDIADSLIALEKWPSQIKVIGPMSEEQRMAMGFRKDSPKLREAFNEYLKQIKADGSYKKLIKKYYPSVFHYYQDYFSSAIES
ncbi:ABC transporter substrate-binding protein [Shewanella hanedai]|uniref:Transporter substrate-binding domain-containing protein n=1 Tax=Shewanella hanedai TaxID=25 RepID=A0A553JTY1_SHEHA|nr:transporter substrate-binding domain-containing protein [Shewanella hanedai]TRY15901.1 transporter substrate-binding domain-containing protein [Shewanella hanedai]GGI69613.1 ABC transporter substrate-binding protein [Shewanella hanedai]